MRAGGGTALAEGPKTLGLFEGYGIELEYMIVDRETLDVRPIADRLLVDADGAIENEVEHGAIAWSNELARHVIELKTNGPIGSLVDLDQAFAADLRRIDALLAPHGARLLPTAMHPWMDPALEFVRWPHGDSVIYATFDRIFDCRGHGWANLQSAHLNLPFDGDDEFARLHAAIRAVLPLLPALAASSPYREGEATGLLDTRLAVYRTNAARVPSVSGQVVPEPVFSHADYQGLLSGIYADIAPLDPEGVLRHEWLNARGAIARFDRSAIEIRVLDVQECPSMDVAIAATISAVLERLCRDDARQPALRALETGPLAELLEAAGRDGAGTRVSYRPLLDVLGFSGAELELRELWSELADQALGPRPEHAPTLGRVRVAIEKGPLAERMLRRTGRRPSRDALRALYAELAACLHENRPFDGA